jgi:hypothetical protein
MLGCLAILERASYEAESLAKTIFRAINRVCNVVLGKPASRETAEAEFMDNSILAFVHVFYVYWVESWNPPGSYFTRSSHSPS